MKARASTESHIRHLETELPAMKDGSIYISYNVSGT